MTATKPPTDDVRLRRYFCDGAADLGFSAAFIGERGAAGAPRTDDKLINRGVVRLDHEKRGPGTATEHRRVHAILQRLEPRIVTVLYLAYGPESAVPGLSLPDDPQARAKLGGHLGQWRNVLVVTWTATMGFKWANAIRLRALAQQTKSGSEERTAEAAKLFSEAEELEAKASEEQLHALKIQRFPERADEAKAGFTFARELRSKARGARRRAERLITFAGHDTVDESDIDSGDVCMWLINGAPPWLIREARAEAAALVSEAWNAWADARGRRPPRPRHVRVERESET